MFSKGVKHEVLNGLWARKLNTQNTLQARRGQAACFQKVISHEFNDSKYV